MQHSDELRRCLEDGDVTGARRVWAHAAPHLPQPATDDEARAVLHRARTEANSVSFERRAYSHRWLEERGLPSGLPDHLKPKAERLYPRIVSAIGISVNSSRPELATLVRHAMEDAVLDAEADGKLEDAEHVKRRMQEARLLTLHRLLG